MIVGRHGKEFQEAIREFNQTGGVVGQRKVFLFGPTALSIKDVTALLSAVGFASPPAWLRPFHVLSTGQQFRVTLALLLATTPAGQRITDQMYAAMLRAQNRLLAPLSADERKAFIDTLLRLIEGNNHLGRTIYNPS